MSKTRAQRIAQRTLVGGGLSVVLAGLLYTTRLPGGDRLLLGATVLLAFVGCYEAVRMGLFGSKTSLPAMWVSVLVASGIWAVVWDPSSGWEAPMGTPAQVYWATLFLSPLIGWVFYLLARLPHRPKEPILKAPGSAMPRFVALLCITSALACMYPVRLFGGVHALIALIVLSKIGDIFGYYCGNMWGKTHPFPRLSPGKTTEGCVGSFVAGCVAGVLCQSYGLLPSGEAAWLPGFWAATSSKVPGSAKPRSRTRVPGSAPRAACSTWWTACSFPRPSQLSLGPYFSNGTWFRSLGLQADPF
jgi:CDP-diglyceride synthetase